MELRHLAYFVSVAEERNFTRAAARLHTVQSGVSAAVKALERDLGAVLLERTSKRVDLMNAGRALLPETRLTLEAARAARDAVDEVGAGIRPRCRGEGFVVRASSPKNAGPEVLEPSARHRAS